MKVKFFAEPNLYVGISNKVIKRMTNLKGFRFDENGEFVSENEFIINAMKTQFKHEEVVEIAETMAEITENPKAKKGVK